MKRLWRWLTRKRYVVITVRYPRPECAPVPGDPFQHSAAIFDASVLRDTPFPYQTANHRYRENLNGKWNLDYDWVDKDGVVVGSGVSINVEPPNAGIRDPKELL